MNLFKKKLFAISKACAVERFGESLVSDLKGFIKCVSLSNHPCQTRPTLVNINCDKAIF